MALPKFQRLTGKQDVISVKTKAAYAFAPGYLLTIDDDSYDLFHAATDKLVCGICLDTKTSDSTTTNVRVDRLKPGDVVRAVVATGTPAITEIGAFADIESGITGITLTESNNDCRIVGWDGSASTMDVEFTSLLAGGPPTATVTD